MEQGIANREKEQRREGLKPKNRSSHHPLIDCPSFHFSLYLLQGSLKSEALADMHGERWAEQNI